MAPQDDGLDEQLDAMQGGAGTNIEQTDAIALALTGNDPEQGEQ